MIGGYDIVLETALSREDRVLVVTYLRRRWPDAVVEDLFDLSIGMQALSPESISVGEYFVYLTDEDRDKWDELGAVDETRDTMVQLVVDEDRLTIVVEPEGVTYQIGKDLSESIKNNRFFRVSARVLDLKEAA